MFYFTLGHGPSLLYFVGSESKKRFGVASNFMFSFVIEISELLSVTFSSLSLVIVLVNVEKPIKMEPPCEV